MKLAVALALALPASFSGTLFSGTLYGQEAAATAVATVSENNVVEIQVQVKQADSQAAENPKKDTAKTKKNSEEGQKKGQPAKKKSKVEPAQAASEEPKESPQIATSEPKDDPEYALLGEYVGPVPDGSGGYTPVGLQVRPLGNDRFEAIQYSGGLPGQEHFSGEPIQLVGRRSGDFLVLSGGPWAIFAEHDSCLIVDRQGNKVGQLERVSRTSPTMGAAAPEGATVLFDGSGVEQFTVARMTEDGLLMEGADVNPMFQDFNLHVEFRLPYMPSFDSQARGNSGCYLQSRYEVQILDSFAQLPLFNGCSSLYRTKAPDVNMCLPPLQWQTYDIQFTAPRWGAGGNKLRNGRLTVWHNGVKTQDDIELPNKTGAGQVEAPTLLPTRFQNHKDPVRFRNIWIVDRGLNLSEFPVYPAAASPKEESAAETDAAK